MDTDDWEIIPGESGWDFLEGKGRWAGVLERMIEGGEFMDTTRDESIDINLRMSISLDEQEDNILSNLETAGGRTARDLAEALIAVRRRKGNLVDGAEHRAREENWSRIVNSLQENRPAWWWRRTYLTRVILVIGTILLGIAALFPVLWVFKQWALWWFPVP